MIEKFMLGNPEELLSTTALREYCDNGRKLLRPLANELHIAAGELEAALRFVPVPHAHFGGVDSRVRAKVVAAHLHRSGHAVEAAVASLVKTFMSYRKHFLDDLGTGRPRGREFKVDE